MSTALVSQATEIARRHAVKAGDAIHIASALRLRQAPSPEVVFVTSDRELLQASQVAGFATLNPEADDALETLSDWRR
ncbi:MAG: hypothetical protein HY645_13335 [Acidobacteria bacterium]|nr:hypothetical protein [Acidobacteriota bacterium]